MKLGEKYNQDSIIYKDKNEFAKFSCEDGNKGKVLFEFNTETSKNKRVMSFSPEATKYFFSALLKGSHRGRKFVFNTK